MSKISRRDFLKMTGMGAATAAILTGCGPASRYVVRQPYVDMPEYNQTGESTYYATTCRECPAGCGLVVRTREGRALKVEGNPAHPVNQGKVCPRGLTSLQGLYNPDRIQGPRKNAQRGAKEFQKLDWDTTISTVKEALQQPPDQVAFLLGLGSDHLNDLVNEITSTLGASSTVRYGALGMFEGRATLVEATRRAFGKTAFPLFDISEADVTFAFGANFLETWLSPLTYSKAYGKMRQGKPNHRGYLVVFEARQSLTAGNADEWIPIVPGTDGLVAGALAALVAVRRGISVPSMFTNASSILASEASGVSIAKLEHLADLLSGAQRPLVLPGGGALAQRQGLTNAEAILELNRMLDNLGKPGGVFLTPGEPMISSISNIQTLVDQMKAGQVKTLFIHGCNPLFELPPALGFSAALGKVTTVISFSSFPDETALQSDYVLPDHTFLEGWGYQRVMPGSDRLTYSSFQPVVVPLYDTRSTVDVLLAAIKAIGGNLATQVNYSDEVDFLQKKILPLIQEPNAPYVAPEILTFWSLFLQHGGYWKTKPALEIPGERPTDTPPLEPQGKPEPVSEGRFFLVTYTTQMGDGSGANRPWLQETPDPTTSVMWNSWVEIHPKTAADLGIEDDDILKISSGSGEVEAIVYKYPAIRPDTVAIPFGQGHSALGRYAEGRGCNPASILEIKLNEAGDLALGSTQVKITPTGRKGKLARMENRTGVYGE